MNWYKKNIKIAYTPGGFEPIMDKYDRGYHPPSASYKEEFNGRVTANPFLGTNIRGKNHHKGTSRLEPEEDDTLTRELPSEPNFIDNPPIGEGVNKEQFVDEEDKMSGQNEISKRLDRGLPPVRKSIYKKLRDGSLAGPITRI